MKKAHKQIQNNKNAKKGIITYMYMALINVFF